MLWSPKEPEAYTIVSAYTQNQFKPGTPPALAVWNLNWLFDYPAHACLDGTIEGITKHYRNTNSKVFAAILSDVEDNVFGIKELAEEVGPVEFMERMLRRPYQQTMLYQFAGEELWKEARVNAERLALTLAGNAEKAKELATKAVNSAKVLQFRRVS